jgi:hypothetical protein
LNILPRINPQQVGDCVLTVLYSEIRHCAKRQNVIAQCKSQPHKQHIWFLPTQKSTLKKPKELFFANARQKDRKKVNFISNKLIYLRKTKTS